MSVRPARARSATPLSLPEGHFTFSMSRSRGIPEELRLFFIGHVEPRLRLAFGVMNRRYGIAELSARRSASSHCDMTVETRNHSAPRLQISAQSEEEALSNTSSRCEMKPLAASWTPERRPCFSRT